MEYKIKKNSQAMPGYFNKLVKMLKTRRFIPFKF